jgi:diguanylate cyclase (GGDEF)-like protein
LGVAPDRVAALDDEVIDAIRTRMKGEEPLGLALQRELLDRLAAQVRELREQSLTDPLTGLPNRRAVESELHAAVARAQRDARPLLVVLVDVDGLKAANDAHGHWAGDALILETAGRLLSVVRRGDLVGRWGGDEFVLVCPDAEAGFVDRLTKQLRDAIDGRPLRLGDDMVPFGLSIGGARVTADSTPSGLLELADAAMYEDKSRRHEGRAGEVSAVAV